MRFLKPAAAARVDRSFALGACGLDGRPGTLAEGEGFQHFLDTLLFEGAAPQKWKPIARKYAYKQLALLDAEQKSLLREEQYNASSVLVGGIRWVSWISTPAQGWHAQIEKCIQ